MFDKQGVLTGIEWGWKGPGILPPSCFFTGLATRPHFAWRRGKELNWKVYHWHMLPANAAYCAMLGPSLWGWETDVGSAQPEVLRNGGGEWRQPARKRTSTAAKFQAGVEVSLNGYHADLESFLQSPGSNSRVVHSATRAENLVRLLTWILPLPSFECILWSYMFSLTIISLDKREFSYPPCPTPSLTHAYF